MSDNDIFERTTVWMAEVERTVRRLDPTPHSIDAYEFRDRFIRERSELRTYSRQSFYNVLDFCLGQPHVFLIPRSESPFEAEDDLWFEEHADWLSENCPSFTRLGPLIGIQDPDEALAWRMRWGGV
ncbi:hypothetical protein [Methylobacterium sp. 13MFTsu3.1M2]|uniref:hypothetical protein n=1 Tax=Methylobacterium sp. 13MFTsu3.1M2 TaxID=1502776 RepID=UPI001114D618|nr:hypothetical protein [Methylobacterium sp. 13MFTsu3.1M2]